MKRLFTVLAFIATLTSAIAAEPRSFRMGFTSWPYAATLEESLRELGAVWLRTGMLKADGSERPALIPWRVALARRYRP